MTDVIDDANDRAQRWLDAQVSEHQYQMEHAAPAEGEPGRCRNCNDETDDGRAYCDKACRDDHWKRICDEKRRGSRK